MKWIFSVTCPFRSEIPLLKTTVCVMGIITSSQSSYFLLKEKKIVFHPYWCPHYISWLFKISPLEPISVNRTYFCKQKEAVCSFTF